MSLQRKIEETTAVILSYSTFKKGWDGYEGCTFQRATLDKAAEIVELLFSTFDNYDACPDEITPSPCTDGSMDIEVEYNGNRVIFTIYPDMVSYYLQDVKESGEITSEDDTFDKIRWVITNEN